MTIEKKLEELRKKTKSADLGGGKERIEKQLFQTWLDIRYADEYNRGIIHDFEQMLKDMKKNARITKKHLKHVVAAYTKVNGKPPKMYRR